MKRRYSFISFLSFGFFILTLITPRTVAAIDVTGGLSIFGGRIVAKKACDCSEGYWIYLTPPNGGPYHIIRQDYREHNLLPSPSLGLWTLGLYIPNADHCLITTYCIELPAKGLINGFVGSSR